MITKKLNNLNHYKQFKLKKTLKKEEAQNKKY